MFHNYYTDHKTYNIVAISSIYNCRYRATFFSIFRFIIFLFLLLKRVFGNFLYYLYYSFIVFYINHINFSKYFSKKSGPVSAVVHTTLTY